MSTGMFRNRSFMSKAVGLLSLLSRAVNWDMSPPQ